VDFRGGWGLVRYQDCAEAVQAGADQASGAEGTSAPRLCDANINPTTGLATDYLNHFNEAIMLLEMLSSCPDCRGDFLAWRPLGYREHFAASRFKGRDVAVAAYEAADPAIRGGLDALAGTMTAVLEATRAAMSADMPRDAAATLAERAAAWLKPLVASAGAVINGESDAGLSQPVTPQAVVDGLMKR
jgi:hypothetical protein